MPPLSSSDQPSTSETPAGASGRGLDALNRLTAEEFAGALSGIFEHSPWIPAAAAAHRPFASVAALHARMVAIAEGAPTERKIALLAAHPELGKRGPLTAESAAEQGGMGLDRLAVTEADRIAALNAAYRARFGYPFIVAVRGQRDLTAILRTLEARLANEPDAELRVALAEVCKIARFRLEDLVADAG